MGIRSKDKNRSMSNPIYLNWSWFHTRLTLAHWAFLEIRAGLSTFSFAKGRAFYAFLYLFSLYLFPPLVKGYSPSLHLRKLILPLCFFFFNMSFKAFCIWIKEIYLHTCFICIGKYGDPFLDWSSEIIAFNR